MATPDHVLRFHPAVIKETQARKLGKFVGVKPKGDFPRRMRPHGTNGHVCRSVLRTHPNRGESAFNLGENAWSHFIRQTPRFSRVLCQVWEAISRKPSPGIMAQRGPAPLAIIPGLQAHLHVDLRCRSNSISHHAVTASDLLTLGHFWETHFCISCASTHSLHCMSQAPAFHHNLHTECTGAVVCTPWLVSMW